MFLQTQLTQDLSVFLLCLVALWLVVGPPTASRRNGPSVPRVSLPGPTGVLRCPGKMASEAERQTLLFWLVLLFVSTSLGGPNKVNVIEPFCSCTCCWNRSRFTCVEGSDINWLSFMSLTIATKNTYTPAQLEALVQSSQLPSSFLNRLRSYHFQLTRKFSLMKSLFEISTHFSCLLSAVS